jgi:hypothetical protein
MSFDFPEKYFGDKMPKSTIEELRRKVPINGTVTLSMKAYNDLVVAARERDLLKERVARLENELSSGGHKDAIRTIKEMPK